MAVPKWQYPATRENELMAGLESVIWDKQHKTHINRKSILRFGKMLNLVTIALILNKIQPFKNLKNFLRDVWEKPLGCLYISY